MKHKAHRKLYKIGHLAEILGLTHRTIRYYDQLGLLPEVKRSDGGVRLFDDEDVVMIKKIRKLQKEDYLPLEVIKDRLFNKTDTPTKSCFIVTDSSLLIDKEFEKKDPIIILPLSVEIDGSVTNAPKQIRTPDIWSRANRKGSTPALKSPSVEEFASTFEALEKRNAGKIYVILSGSMYSNSTTIAKEAAKRINVDIEIIDTKATGLGLGLLVKNVLEAIEKGLSVDKIDHLITKQLPMLYHIGVSHDFKNLLLGKQYPKDSNAGSQLLEQIYGFSPVFIQKDNSETIEVSSCLKTKEEAYAHILEKLAEEFEARGRYTNRIIVGYDYHLSEAKNLLNDIKTIFPNTPATLIELDGLYSVEYGPHNIAVALI